MNDAHKRYQTAKQEGIEAGIKGGRQESIMVAQQAKIETKRQVIFNVINQGYGLSSICFVTGLTKDEIKKLHVV